MIPQLYVFVGPNGAGKSSFSGLMLGPDIPVFDGDKEVVSKTLIKSVKSA